jgi:hypothetical protein
VIFWSAMAIEPWGIFDASARFFRITFFGMTANCCDVVSSLILLHSTVISPIASLLNTTAAPFDRTSLPTTRSSVLNTMKSLLSAGFWA